MIIPEPMNQKSLQRLMRAKIEEFDRLKKAALSVSKKKQNLPAGISDEIVKKVP